MVAKKKNNTFVAENGAEASEKSFFVFVFMGSITQ